MLHMTNIRELKFVNSFVDAEHWNAMATLPSLEKLLFFFCQFLQSPAEKRAEVKVSHLQLPCDNSEVRQPLAAINAQYLRALDMDHRFLHKVDWYSLSSLRELYFHATYLPCATREHFMERLHTFLMQAPQSLERLELVVDIYDVAQDTIRHMFDDPAWKNLARLRSLALVVEPLNMIDVSQPPASSIARLVDPTPGPLLSLGGRWCPHEFTITHAGNDRAIQGDLRHRGSARHL